MLEQNEFNREIETTEKNQTAISSELETSYVKLSSERNCYDFVELVFVKWNAGCQMVSRSSIKGHKRK